MIILLQSASLVELLIEKSMDILYVTLFLYRPLLSGNKVTARYSDDPCSILGFKLMTSVTRSSYYRASVDKLSRLGSEVRS